MLDRKTIKSTLEKMRSGELSPDQATQFLLGREIGLVDEAVDESNCQGDSQPSPPESLASIIDRLGVPPVDVVDTWCGQLEFIAARYEQQSGESMPTIALRDCYLNERGDLALTGFADQIADDGTSPRETTGPSLKGFEQIESFRTALLEGLECTPYFTDAASAKSEPTQTAKSKHRDPHPLVRQSLMVAGLIGCAIAAGYVVYLATEDEPVAIAKKPKPTSEDIFAFGKTGSSSVKTSRQKSLALPKTETPEQLETLESMTEDELASLESSASGKATSFSLDAFMPAAASFAPEVAPNSVSDFVAAEISDGDVLLPIDAMETAKTPSNDGSIELPTMQPSPPDDANPPPESEQPTGVGVSAEPTTTAIELPPTDAAEPSFAISDRKPKSLTLDFPVDVPIELADAGDAKWQLNDTRKQTPIAEIATGDDGITFAWADTMAQSSSANQLVHGRIRDESGGTIYMRPLVEGELYALRLQTPDVMPTWNLRAPIPPRVARISIDFKLPDGVELGWIEPIEPDAIRRARGLAVITPSENESVSLGLRFDIRCSRKLECRIRFAGRLDSSMPWNAVSTSGLDTFADQLTYQAGLVSNEAQRLSNVYDMAGSMGKRIIKIKQSRNDGLADNIRMASRRTSELQTLIAKVESGATLQIRVWIEWPDTEQSILMVGE